MSAVTLEDVAARVGVSAKTVSRVVNGNAKVSPETRERIEAVIAEMGFRPNHAARSLATSRSYLIGTFAPPSPSFYYGALIRFAIGACRDRGYNLVVADLDFTQASAFKAYDSSLRNLRCDGFILPPPVCDDLMLLEALDRDGVRYVCISPTSSEAPSAAVLADDAVGVAALARHLWSIGRRRFGLVAGIPGMASTQIRRDAFVATITELAGGSADIEVAEWEEVSRGIAASSYSIPHVGRNAAALLLAGPSPRDAVFCYNDELAATIMACAHARGIRIPHDVAVAGFDDSDVAKLCWPALTTIRQPIEAMAARAVELLVSGAGPADDPTIFPVELQIRESTSGVPPLRDV